jgi:hypothetical protein
MPDPMSKMSHAAVSLGAIAPMRSATDLDDGYH